MPVKSKTALCSLLLVLFVFALSISAQTSENKSPAATNQTLSPSHAENDPPAAETGEKLFETRRKPGKETGKNPDKKDDSPDRDNADSDDTANPPLKNYRLQRGAKDFNIEFGISPFNPSNFAGPKEFDVYGRDLNLITFRFGRVIGTKKNVTYQYMFGFSPLAIFTKNEVVNPDHVSDEETPTVPRTKRETTYGFGVQPVNFKFIFLAKNRLKPYAQVGTGILITNKAVPVPQSTLFQLTGDFGGGFMYMLSPTKAVNLGYKYFHISNGNINGKINNPGFNANVFYLNYSFFRK
jgi:hypothetical protein